jgi:hypothetical protein
MIQNSKVVYDSEGEIVCSPTVPSDFRTTLTGVRVAARPTCTMQVKVNKPDFFVPPSAPMQEIPSQSNCPSGRFRYWKSWRSVFGRGTAKESAA